MVIDELRRRNCHEGNRVSHKSMARSPGLQVRSSLRLAQDDVKGVDYGDETDRITGSIVHGHSCGNRL